MTNKERETIQRVIGTLDALSFDVDGGRCDLIIDMIGNLENMLKEDENDESYMGEMTVLNGDTYPMNSNEIRNPTTLTEAYNKIKGEQCYI